MTRRVNCAARSCPPLWPQAYTAETLEHVTRETFIAVPVVATENGVQVIRWRLHTQREGGWWPPGASVRLWSRLKTEYF